MFDVYCIKKELPGEIFVLAGGVQQKAFFSFGTIIFVNKEKARRTK